MPKGLLFPLGRIKIVSMSCKVRNISRKRPRVMLIEGSSVVATGSGPGSSAETTAAAQMPPMSCAKMAWTARSGRMAPIKTSESVT